MSIKRMNWDSDFFGFNICQIELKNNISSDEINHIICRLKNESFKLCYFFLPKENKSVNNFFNRNNIPLVDEKILYTLKIDNKLELLYSKNICEYSEYDCINELINLSIQSSHKSRFRIDKNFSPVACDKLYKIWIEKSISGILADKVYVFKNVNNVIQGMITLKRNDNFGSIGLISVDTNVQGEKIGKKLLHRAFKYFLDNDINKVNVVTQWRNEQARKFYERNGFVIDKITNIYHLWI